MKRMLSIDGGGMKGYIPCALLGALEAKTGKKCHEMFNLVAGTSIGGILAALIATGRSATESLEFFTSDGPAIFGKGQLFGNSGIVRPRYGAETIETRLQERFCGRKLSDCKIKLLVPAFDLVGYEPYFFKSFKTDKDYPLWQVARATSAAQTYFPGYKLDDKIFWDGGNVANNPAGCAAAECIKLWGDEQFQVLSLGCGAARSKIKAESLINAGILPVGIETMSLLLDANDELPNYMLNQFLDDGSYLRVQPTFPKTPDLDGADQDDLTQLHDYAWRCISQYLTTVCNFLKL